MRQKETKHKTEIVNTMYDQLIVVRGKGVGVLCVRESRQAAAVAQGRIAGSVNEAQNPASCDDAIIFSRLKVRSH